MTNLKFEGFLLETDEMTILFSKFGEAVFRAECLERTVSEILSELSGDAGNFRNQRYSFFLDEKIDKNFQRLIDALQSRFPVTGEMENGLRTALRKRNWLLHDYWWDRNIDPDNSGNEKLEWMKDELQELADLFRGLDTGFRELAGIREPR